MWLADVYAKVEFSTAREEAGHLRVGKFRLASIPNPVVALPHKRYDGQFTALLFL